MPSSSVARFGIRPVATDIGGKVLAALRPADRQAAPIEALRRSGGGYAAPEQLLGQTPDHRPDLFALCALFYEMATGKHAFAGRSTLEIGVNILQTRPPGPTAFRPDLPRALDWITGKALAKKPADRYQDAALMAADLRDAEAALQSQTADVEPVVRKRRSPRRAAACAFVLLALSALGLWHWREPLLGAWQARFGKTPEPVLVVLPYYVAPVDTPRPYRCACSGWRSRRTSTGG